MGLTNKNVGPKILAKIKIYVLIRAQLLFKVCYEIPCKRPGPSQKKLIILFCFRAAAANFWTLLNNLVWMKVSFKRPVLSFFQILEA